MARLEILNLQKTFGEVVALRDFSLSVKSGEFVSLLGPSGCGKTTVLRIVAGFEQASGGRVIIEDLDVTDIPANRRDIGMVFQAYSLFPNMTVRENVGFGLRVRKMARPQRLQKADELLELVGLASAAGRYPHQLSGGQQQRVALARALAIQPRMLLLDEPLSALDAQVRLQLRDEIRRVQTALGITTLFVTHDQEEALSISDRVVVLSQGAVEQVGTPAEIYNAPHTAFVAQFVGTMNRIAGTARSNGRGMVDSRGVSLLADSALAHPNGTDVLLLLRPETITVQTPDSVADAAPALSGRIRGHTFLGSITRLSVATDVGDMLVDVPSNRALTLAEGSPVLLQWDAHAPHVLHVPAAHQVDV